MGAVGDKLLLTMSCTLAELQLTFVVTLVSLLGHGRLHTQREGLTPSGGLHLVGATGCSLLGAINTSRIATAPSPVELLLFSF